MVTWGYGIIWQRGSWLRGSQPRSPLTSCSMPPSSGRQVRISPANLATSEHKNENKIYLESYDYFPDNELGDNERGSSQEATLFKYSPTLWIWMIPMKICLACWCVRFFLMLYLDIFLSAPFQRVDKLSASASTFNVACTHYRKQRPAILWYWTSFTALISHKNTILWPQRDTMHRIFQHFWSSWNKKKENIEATRQFSSPIVSIERGARLGSDCRLIPAPAFRW